MFVELNMFWELRVVGFERLSPLMSRTSVRGFMMPAHPSSFQPHREAERGAVSPSHYSWGNRVREAQARSETTEL